MSDVPYEDPIALLRDIRNCVLQSVADSVDHGNHSGPWLPQELNARISRVLFRDTHVLDDETRVAVATLQGLGVMDKPVHGGYPDDPRRPFVMPSGEFDRKGFAECQPVTPTVAYDPGAPEGDHTVEVPLCVHKGEVVPMHQQTPGGPLIHPQVVEDVKGLPAVVDVGSPHGDHVEVVGHKGETVGSVGPTFVSHREMNQPPDTFHNVGRILPASRLKPVKGLVSDTFEECTHFVAPVDSYYRFNTSHGVPLTIWLKKGDSVRASICEDVCCPDCGAGDDDHHSYSCPTGLLGTQGKFTVSHVVTPGDDDTSSGKSSPSGRRTVIDG